MGQRAALGPQASNSQFYTGQRLALEKGEGRCQGMVSGPFAITTNMVPVAPGGLGLFTEAVKALSWLHPHPPVWWGPLTAPKSPTPTLHFFFF